VLAISEKPRPLLEVINTFFPIKDGSIGPPDIYLGSKIQQVALPNGVKAWASSSSQYVSEVVKGVEAELAKKGEKLQPRAPTLIASGYRPKLDVSPECCHVEASYYGSLIGILRWAVELGRVDITTAVSMMSSHLALPRVGYLAQLFHIFSYLKKRHNAEMVFDPSYPVIQTDLFPERDWKNFYPDTKEEVVPDAPEPLGKEVVIRHWVDADHAGDQITRRSHTGYSTFLNSACIQWYSKHQNLVETLTFGIEFMSLQALRDNNKGLRSMGVPISGPSCVSCDNNSVVCNTTAPESTLKKNSNVIAYHCVRESITCGEMLSYNGIQKAMNPISIRK
jgi:hypothetical protein